MVPVPVVGHGRTGRVGARAPGAVHAGLRAQRAVAAAARAPVDARARRVLVDLVIAVLVLAVVVAELRLRRDDPTTFTPRARGKVGRRDTRACACATHAHA